MTEEEFELLILKSEGETIDYKREQYELINSNDDNKAKLVKDIISFTNTIRKESAFIIIGIESVDNRKTFHGLNKHIDDSIFQDQLKTRVYPIPQFSYSTIKHKGLDYGIVEIPLKRYSEPISPIVKMKGLEPGRIYMRRGSSNSEAIGKEILLLDKWIKNVKTDHDSKSEIDELLKEINSGQKKLSYYISSAFKISNDFQDNDLIRFCKGELTGWYQNYIELDDTNIPTHRKTTLMASIHKITSVTVQKGQYLSLKDELKEDKDFREIPFLIQEPITQIESTIENSKNSSYLTLERKLGDIVPNASKHSNIPFYIYSEIDNYKNVYQSIKTELIRLLIKVKE